jgi:hypothetical protein
MPFAVTAVMRSSMLEFQQRLSSEKWIRNLNLFPGSGAASCR